MAFAARETGYGSAPQSDIPTRAQAGQPHYKVDNEDTLAPRWWDVRQWSAKKLLLVGAGLAALIIILVVVIVEEEKKNVYPTYTALNYTLADTCKLSSPFQACTADTSQTPEPISSPPISTTTIPMIQPMVSSTTSTRTTPKLTT